MKKQWSMVIAIVLVLLIVILSVLNVDPVLLNFGFAQVEWPLIIVIIGSLLIGAIIASLLSTMRMYQERKQRKQLEKDLQTADETKNREVHEAEEKYQANISKLEAELDEEKRKVRELNRKLSNIEKTQHEV